jgi:hypothetical protein
MGGENISNYEPKPIDTSGVTLPEEILELTELLAKNAHDVWAQQRLSEGWIWGTERDDAAKKHPALVPYDQLPDSEKQYDRNGAMETLKAILAMGYRIAPPACNRPAAPDSSTPVDKEPAAVLQNLEDPTALDQASLLAICGRETRTAGLTLPRSIGCSATGPLSW